MTSTWVLSDEQCEIRFGKGKQGVKRSGDREDVEEVEVKQMLFDREMFSDNDQAVIDHMVKAEIFNIENTLNRFKCPQIKMQR